MKKLLALVLLIGFAIAATGQQVESALSGYVKTDGTALANGYLDFYENDGSSTHKAVYSDSGLTTVIPQPIKLNNAGMPTSGGIPVAIFASGKFRITWKTSTGNILYNRSGVSYSGAVDFGGLYIDVATTSRYGFTDTGLTNLISDINPALTYTFLFKPGTYISSTPHTFPANATLKFMQGAYLNTSIGNTTKINGWVDAGAYQIFNGAGTTTLTTANSYSLASWYGLGSSFQTQRLFSYAQDFCEIRATVNLADANSAAVTADQIVTDNYNMAKIGSQMVTINSTGVYLLSCQSSVTVVGVVDIGIEVFKVGVGYVLRDQRKYTSGATGNSAPSAIAYLNKGDVLQMYVTQTSGGTRATSSHFKVLRLF